jgi:hypothetical protein
LADLHQAIAELPTGAVLLAEDEAHINLLPWVRSTWIPRGTRQEVMTPGKNRRRTIFGAVDLHTGRFLYQVAHKAISASFIAFCQQLLAAYPTAPVVAVICDNVIIHRSKIVQRWLAAHPRLLVLHGARYSPHDNPVERGLGRAEGMACQQPDPDHPRPHPPSACLLSAAHHRADASDRRTAQLTVAARRLRAELQAGRLAGQPTLDRPNPGLTVLADPKRTGDRALERKLHGWASGPKDLTGHTTQLDYQTPWRSRRSGPLARVPTKPLHDMQLLGPAPQIGAERQQAGWR